jgi:4-amino-4-deoxy-L-arabinose transferase-like glycosyltransferase
MRNPIKRTQLERFADHLILLLLAGACYIFFFHGLATIGLLGPDEPRYASISREMYQSGDYITPRLNGEPWFEKPALLYWLSALGFGIFGVGEFAARLPSALAAAATIFFMYFVARKLWGRLVAAWASLILVSCAGYVAFGRAASMDMLLTACLTSAFLSFLMGYNLNPRDGRRRVWFFLFYAFIGVGVLAKGPVALVLPALSLGCYLLFQARRSEWKEWHPAYALVIVLIAAPWYLAVLYANGYKFIAEFIIYHNLVRFATTAHGHPRPFYFYVPDLMLLAFPWTFMLIPALRRTLERSDRILFWVAVVPIVFFSLSGSKLPGYILPSIPPIALLCARAITNISSRAFRIAVFIEAGMMAFIGVAFGFYGQMLNVDPHVSRWLIAELGFGVALMLTAIALFLRPWALAAFNFLTMTVVVVVGTTFVLPRFETTDTMRPWVEVLRAKVPSNQMIFVYHPPRWVEYGIQFYRSDNTHIVWTPDALDAALKSDSKVLFISDEKGQAELTQVAGLEMRVVTSVGNQWLFWAWRTH